MKIRNKSRKIEIQKIHLDKDYQGGCNISFIINGQYTELYCKTIYIDDILNKVNEYLKVISDDDLYFKI